MAKRTASSNLNHDNWDEEEESEEAGSFVPANPEVLKDRVIKKAKRRGVGPSDGANASVFSGFGGFKTTSTGAASTLGAAASATGAFDFLSGENKNGASSGPVTKSSFSFTSPDKAVSDGTAKSVAPVFAFGTGSAPRDSSFGSGIKPATTGFSFGAKPATSEPEKKVAFAFGDKSALNEPAKTGFSFGDKSAAAKPSDSPVTGFSFGKMSSTTTTTTTAEPTKPPPSFLFGEKSAEPAKTGFGFGEKSEPAKPSFSFGGSKKLDSSPKPSFGFGEKSSVTSEKPKADEKKTEEGQQPSLMDLFKPKAGTWVCSVCDVSNGADKNECVACTTPKPGGAPAAAAPAAKKWECPTCMVPNDADKTSCVCCETAKPGSAPAPKSSSGFGAGIFGAGPGTGSGFKFGVTPGASTTETPASGFKFGDSAKSGFGTDSAASKGSGFKFGATTASTTSTASGFKFGSEKDSEKSSKKSESGEEKKDYPKEFLAELKGLNSDVLEWVKTHVSKNPYIYLTPVFKDYEKHLAELKAKHKVTSVEGSTSTGFVSTSSESVESKPAAAETTGFKFGNGSTSATPTPATPSFSFGDSSSKKKDFGSEPAKTGFSFGSTGSEPAKTGFSFGGSASSFGSTAGTFGSFGSSSTFSAAAATAAEPAESKDDDDDEPPKVEVAPVVEEDSIYSVRCKLFYKKGGEFVDKGLGMLHLKPVEGTKKTQLLVRAETNFGNILLNIFLNGQMSLLKRTNNIQFFCIPNPPIPGLPEGPVNMLVKVKNADMANELESKIKERLEQEN